jgi:hypothetical protein
MKERIGYYIEEKDLSLKKINFSRKSTNSRSIGYTVVNETPIKIVYSKSIKKIITILPMNYAFQHPPMEENNGWFEYLSDDNNNAYRIRIYPDCYIESEDSRCMTLFEIWNDKNGCWETKKKINKIFNEIFGMAWRYYEHCKKTQTNSPS